MGNIRGFREVLASFQMRNSKRFSENKFSLKSKLGSGPTTKGAREKPTTKGARERPTK